MFTTPLAWFGTLCSVSVNRSGCKSLFQLLDLLTVNLTTDKKRRLVPAGLLGKVGIPMPVIF